MDTTTTDGAGGRHDLEPFWPSRQGHHFDQTCPRVPGAHGHASA
ncbi:hypothetical protein [Streptacidiphilus sp. ASG 303]|nr:hypothetical protein [Streptacidiphilus sp. ASG 303]